MNKICAISFAFGGARGGDPICLAYLSNLPAFSTRTCPRTGGLLEGAYGLHSTAHSWEGFINDGFAMVRPASSFARVVEIGCYCIIAIAVAMLVGASVH